MKKTTRFLLVFFLFISLVLSACGETSQTAGASLTPDPCAPENIRVEVEKVHKLMREFDDASLLAASTPREQIRPAIADLQEIRRAAEDQKVPACLGNLKTYQITHMNTVINTLVSFMGGTSDQETMNQGIALARQQHDQYTLELARLLGVTVMPAAPPVVTSTP